MSFVAVCIVVVAVVVLLAGAIVQLVQRTGYKAYLASRQPSNPVSTPPVRSTPNPDSGTSGATELEVAR